MFFILSPENDILNKRDDIVLIKSYATSDFDASPKELQLLKTSVPALEQPHPFLSLISPAFQDGLKSELAWLPSLLTSQEELGNKRFHKITSCAFQIV